MKVGAGIGQNIRATFNNDWKLVSSSLRTIAVRRIHENDRFQTCQDCGKESKYFVVELTRFTPIGKRGTLPLVWGWCGYCDLHGNVNI